MPHKLKKKKYHKKPRVPIQYIPFLLQTQEHYIVSLYLHHKDLPTLLNQGLRTIPTTREPIVKHVTARHFHFPPYT